MSTTYKWLIAIIVIIIIIAGIWYYETKPTVAPGATGPIKVGVATLLSGDYASLGDNIVNTAKLAIDKINKNGGINGRQVELLVEDSGLDCLRLSQLSRS